MPWSKAIYALRQEIANRRRMKRLPPRESNKSLVHGHLITDRDQDVCSRNVASNETKSKKDRGCAAVRFKGTCVPNSNVTAT